MFRNFFSFRKDNGDVGGHQNQLSATSQALGPAVSPSEVTCLHQERSAISTLSIHPDQFSSPPSKQSGKHEKAGPGPLGLNVVHNPENGYTVDIVFIHGLGGASHKTWSKNQDPELFWPSNFLPQEPHICKARILTFGYNANFRAVGRVSTSILDFAKDLLFDLKFAKDERRNEDLNIGHVPLLFVVHSMGGLVLKEAYMQGQNDPEYEPIIKAISAIIFLATPHRGANLVQALNLILKSTVVVNPKQYISELAKNSITLQRLNEQFRHAAPKLDIVSFYETQATFIGLKRVTILEKDSSTLGYPGELSRALNADHHGVCKYGSLRDPNYIAVRNALASRIQKITATRPSMSSLPDRTDPKILKSLLAISELPDVDYTFFRDQWTLETSEWFLAEQSYFRWLRMEDQSCSLLWLKGGAATGKSVLSSFVINNLIEQGVSCQYFFIRFGDGRKRTLSGLLRSLAYQVAVNLPSYSKKITELADEGIDLSVADAATIWSRLFKSTLFKMKDHQPLYWIIDGIDEADDSRAFIRLLLDMSLSSIPIRVMLASRDTLEISESLSKISKRSCLNIVSIEGNSKDLQYYVGRELSMPGTSDFKQNITRRILDRAQNNFLWVRLIVERLNSCHTEAEVELAIQHLPTGMDSLYDRMALSIADNPSASHRALASTVLQCVTTSLRSLTMAELLQALHGDALDMLDPRQSIKNLCGGFVVVDNDGNVSLIHQTAREYLFGRADSPFLVDHGAAHRQMFPRCMRCLIAIGLRTKLGKSQKLDFAHYAATSWSSHLVAASADSDEREIVETLSQFLTGQWVLTWIQILATSDQLGLVAQASKHPIKHYTLVLGCRDAAHVEQSISHTEHQLLMSWAEDFVRVVGNFGTILRQDPEAIHTFIPPFCPQNSAVYKHFGNTKNQSLVVSGLPNLNWDDWLTRITWQGGSCGSLLLVSGARIYILAGKSVVICDAIMMGEETASRLGHSESISLMEMNSTGTILATYGRKTTKFWDLSTGECNMTVENRESTQHELAMRFTKNDTRLLVGTQGRQIFSLDLESFSPTWQLLTEFKGEALDGSSMEWSTYMAFNNDGTLLAVACGGQQPLSAYEIDGSVHIADCWQELPFVSGRGEVLQGFWHPHRPEILGLYLGGNIFRWRPYDGENYEVASQAKSMVVSGDGNLFAFGDHMGSVKVYTTDDFSFLCQMDSKDHVASMAFSPDLRRMYDLRGDYVTVWEPSALLRFEGYGKNRFDHSKARAPAASSLIQNGHRAYEHEWTTALAGSPTGRMCFSGTSRGCLRIYYKKLESILASGHIDKSFPSIIHISFSNDGRHVCHYNTNRVITRQSLIPRDGGLHPIIKWEDRIEVSKATDGLVLQLLFHPDSSQLLVRSSLAVCTVSLATSSVTRYTKWPKTDGSTWLIHPQDPTLILGVGPYTVDILDWNLTRRQTLKLEYFSQRSQPLDSKEAAEQLAVDRVLITKEKSHALIQMSSLNRRNPGKAFFYFETSACPTSSNLSTPSEAPSIETPTAATSDTEDQSGSTSITLFAFPRKIFSEITQALSILPHNNLIFLSKNLSVCSIRLWFQSGVSFTSQAIPAVTKDDTRSRSDIDYAGNDGPKRLFWVPPYWLNRGYFGQDSSPLCSVWTEENSFLCPVDDRVAIVQCKSLR